MVNVIQSLKSGASPYLAILNRFRLVWIALIPIVLGFSFGQLIRSSVTGELVVSIVAVVILLFIVMKRPLNGLLLLLFFMVFIDSWIEVPMGAGIPDFSFSRFAIAFIGIFMLAQGAIGKFRFAPIGWAEIFAVATVIGIGSAAPLSISPSPKGVLQSTIIMHITPLAMYFFAKNLVKDRKDLHQVLLVIAILGFVSGVYTIYEYTTDNVLFLPKDREVYRFFRGGDSEIQLIIGIMGGSGQMGRALATIIPITFYLFLEQKKNGPLKLILGIMIVFQFIGIVLAMSRTPWYALILALFVMQFFYPQFRKLFIIILLVGAVVVWASWDRVNQSQAAERFNDDNSTLEGREARWQAGYNMFEEKPIRGWGFGAYEQFSGRYRTDGVSKNFKAVENDYLYLVLGAGLIGLMPYLLFIAVLLINSLRLFFKARAPDWSGFIKPETLTVVWAVLIVLLLTSYTAKQVQPVLKMVPFAVAGAIVGSHEYLLRSKKKKHVPLKEETTYGYSLPQA